MMFGARPPSVMIPWMRASPRSCCRRALRLVKDSSTASSALIPRCGAAAAWLDLPKNSTCSARIARAHLKISFLLLGWTRSAASTPANSPALTRAILPPPLSSAGQPITCTWPGQEGRRKAPGPFGHLETAPLQKSSQSLGRFPLLIGQFGVLMEEMAGGHQLVGHPIDRLGDLIFERHHPSVRPCTLNFAACRPHHSIGPGLKQARRAAERLHQTPWRSVRTIPSRCWFSESLGGPTAGATQRSLLLIRR